MKKPQKTCKATCDLRQKLFKQRDQIALELRVICLKNYLNLFHQIQCEIEIFQEFYFETAI